MSESKCTGNFFTFQFNLTVFVLIFGYFLSWWMLRPGNPMIYYDTNEMIKNNDYPCEIHQVLTADGYQLDMHRISLGTTSQIPVILVHGFTCSSSMWVLQGPDKDLAYRLADKGFDVWLANLRGNSYTEVKCPEKTANDHSFHEMAQYDLPAMVDYVLNTTGYSKVGLVGHSMGTTVIVTALSLDENLNEKISHAALIAPMVNRAPFTELPHKILEWAYLASGPLGNEVNDVLGVFLRGPVDRLLGWMVSEIPSIFRNPVAETWRFFAGPNTLCQLGIQMEVLSAHVPDAVVHHTLDHYYTNMMTGEFRMRNYGPEENLKRYNSTKPPYYDLSQIDVPISAYLGDADIISRYADFQEFIPKFRHTIEVNEYKGFNHIDLVWSREAMSTVFERVTRNLALNSSTCVRKKLT